MPDHPADDAPRSRLADTDGLLSAAEAANRLGVKRETLYAYVSRGRLTAHRLAGRRGSFFDPLEVDALAVRAREPSERRPELRMRSAVTLIEDGRYWYRGRDPARLAAERSLESVAELLWTGRDVLDPPPWPADPVAASTARQAQALLPGEAGPVDRLRVVVAVLAGTDPFRGDLRAEGALTTARRLMATATTALVGEDAAGGTVAERVTAMLAPADPLPGTVEGVRIALVVMADHELAASTVAVRIAASFRADPYSAVGAGLGAVAGPWHGAASLLAGELLADVERDGDAATALARRLRTGEPVPGLGQPLYPAGDPRAPILFAEARRLAPGAPVHDALDRLLAVVHERELPPPNVDLGLAVLARALRLAPRAAEALFVIGRMVGWLAHAIEEYGSRTDMRLRAVYTGPRP